MPDNNQFSLERFEQLVHQRQYEVAARELLILLNTLDVNYGAWEEIGTRTSNDRSHDHRDRHIIARTTAAIGTLFADPEFKVSMEGWGEFLPYHRWLQILFGACDFDGADHILHLMKNTDSHTGQLTFDDPGLIKFSLLYSGDSQIPLQMEPIWNKDPHFAAGLFMAILSSRLSVSEAASEKKETLLQWLPKRINQIELADAHVRFLHDVYMHCSYSFTPHRHDIKAALNTLLKKGLTTAGCEEATLKKQPKPRSRPIILMPLEWFTSTHAVYRCFSPAIESLREKFHLIALCTSRVIDDVSRKIFDEVVVIEPNPDFDMVKEMAKKAIEIKPDIVFYPSIGMQLSTVALANFRYAPIQLHTWGHPATTHSSAIDYFVLEEGYMNDPDCFSEKVVLMPNGSMSFTLPTEVKQITPFIHEKPDTIKIAVTASVMKLNPEFLKACRRIYEESSTPIEFHFFVGFGIGVTRHYITNKIERYLENVIVFPHTTYNDYINNLNECDIFLSPFPFGNTNGIVDAARQGIPGVCLDGPELFSHIDGELFSRLSLPEWLNTQTIEEYIAAAIKLVDEHSLRTDMSKDLLTIDPDQVLFEGNTEQFCDAIWWLYKNHETLEKDNSSSVRPNL